MTECGDEVRFVPGDERLAITAHAGASDETMAIVRALLDAPAAAVSRMYLAATAALCFAKSTAAACAAACRPSRESAD